MRLIATFESEEKVRTLSQFLTSEKIKNQIEVIEKPEEDDKRPVIPTYNLWVIDEDDAEVAFKWLKYFSEHPQDPRFEFHKPLIGSMLSFQEEVEEKTPIKPPPPPPKRPIGFLTLYLIITCTVLLFFGQLSTPLPFVRIPKNIPGLAVYSPPINKTLMYDWPKNYQLIDSIVRAYGIESLQNPNALPEEGRFLYREFLQTPYWHGIYDMVVARFKSSEPTWENKAPLFEKIKEGEIWRLFTPCILHAGIFHLFFNMLWLLILGKQIERKIGLFRYVILIVLSAIVSNTAQYIMSGPNFVGFSGVLCAMIAFIWVREKKAPWEGYQLHPSTLTFILVILGLMLVAQLISFGLEISGYISVSLPIANTAHISGAVVGYLLGKWNLFSWKGNSFH